MSLIASAGAADAAQASFKSVNRFGGFPFCFTIVELLYHLLRSFVHRYQFNCFVRSFFLRFSIRADLGCAPHTQGWRDDGQTGGGRTRTENSSSRFECLVCVFYNSSRGASDKWQFPLSIRNQSGQSIMPNESTDIFCIVKIGNSQFNWARGAITASASNVFLVFLLAASLSLSLTLCFQLPIGTSSINILWLLLHVCRGEAAEKSNSLPHK